MIEKEKVFDTMKSVCEKFVGVMGNEVFARMPEIKIETFNKGKCAGQAFLNENRVRINVSMPEEALEETIVHEIAHLLAYSQGKDKGHGPAWKHIMQKMGYAGNRTHALNLPPGRIERRWSYVCGCDEYSVSTRLHNKIRRRDHVCKRCDQKLRHKGQIMEVK